jgi:phospholipid N-methyltransferase
MATGAIVPSSDALGKAIVRNLDLSHAKAVVEYGPGTGAFTTYVLQSLDHDARLISI